VWQPKRPSNPPAFEESITVSEVRIAAEQRTEFGKGAARRTRRAGKIPAVLYGHGQDPRHISLPARDFANAIRGGGANTLLSVEMNGSSELALPKQIQRDPVRGTIEHVDLILVRRGEKVTVSVAVLLTGEVAPDGLVTQDLNALEVQADATRIPEALEVSVEGLPIGAHVTAGEVALPRGVTLVTDPEHLVVAVQAAPTAAEVEAELAEAEAGVGIERVEPAAEVSATAQEPAEVS
jgi:large subunit ribosomal protein L25